MTDKNQTTQKPKKKNKIKHKYNTKKENFILFLKKIYVGELTYNNIYNKLINAIKVMIVSTKKFMQDDCLTKASSISYTAVMSLIPALFVILTGYSFFRNVGRNKEDLFAAIQIFFNEHNINISIAPILTAVSGLIDNAGKITIIGGIFMIFTATAMLRSLEKSLNDIFKAQKNRPFFLRIIYYWAILTLGPIMLAAGTTVATQISAMFSSPNFNAGYVAEDQMWIVGNSGSILKAPIGNVNIKEIHEDAIDLDNQKLYEYDKDKNIIKVKKGSISRIEVERTNYNDIQFIDNNGWIVGDNGFLLYSQDKGNTWFIKKLDPFKLNDIHMFNSKRGLIAADGGKLLTTEDGGISWKILEWEGKVENLNSITFYKNRGIVTGDNGLFITTDNGGITWHAARLKAAQKLRGRYVDLNKAFFANNSSVIVAGSEGTILVSYDGGSFWQSRGFKEYNYGSLHFFNPRNGLVAGDRGIISHTSDGGMKWHKKKMPAYRINQLLGHDDKVYAIGDTGLFMISNDQGISWEGREGRSFISMLFNFFAPFVFIWLLFLVAYISIPSTKVPLKHASIGASFTGAVWVTFLLLFIYYVKVFARGTFAIYGALAAIPLFLLIVYTSSLIILFGAEVAYTLMHPESYRSLKKLFQKKEYIHVYYGIAILFQIYKKFEQGSGPTFFQELLTVASHKTEEIDFYTQLFSDHNLISPTSENGYVPTNTSKNIKLADVIEIITNISFNMPAGRKSGFKDYMEKLFNDLADSRRKIVGDVTLRDIIKASE